MCPARHSLPDCIVSAIHVHPDVGMALESVKLWILSMDLYRISMALAQRRSKIQYSPLAQGQV